MIYTVGHEANYREAITQYGTIQKLGKDQDYTGGVVFETIADAERYLRQVDHESDWCVWGVDADWQIDTEPSAVGWWHFLLVDKDIVDLRKRE